MRLSLPLRVSVPKTIAFAAVLLAVEQFQHTHLAFSLLAFMFIIVSTVTFNLAGGFSRASGGYVFFFSVLSVVFGLVSKAAVGEAADSNLEAPLVTMSAFACGITMMMVAVFLSRKFTLNAAGAGILLGSSRLNLTYCGVGCMIVGVAIAAADLTLAVSSGSILSGLNQINFFLPLGVILVTVDVLRKTDGHQGLNAISIGGILVGFVIGTVGFSKQGMFTPFAAWAVGAMYGRLRVRWTHVVSAAAFVVLAFTVLTPVSQIGKDFESPSLPARIAFAYTLLTHLGETREQYTATSTEVVSENLRHGYFNNPQGLVERLTMISSDDGLIAYTERGNVLGYVPIQQYFENWLPHFLAPNKVLSYSGNYYAHEIGGVLSNDDLTTGISFGPIGECFHLGRWTGIFLLAPIIWFMLFVSTDLVCGDLRRSPWGLMALLAFAHIAPESGISGPIYFMWYGNLGILVTLLFCVYMAPILGRLLSGTARTLPGPAPAVVRRAGEGFA